MNVHPCLNDKGQKVFLSKPDEQTPLASWSDPNAVARVTPQGEMPKSVCGKAICNWKPPSTIQGWQDLADERNVDEPPFNAPAGKRAAAGVVVQETDGRFWLVAPSNGYAGYQTTFPKGTREKGLSLQASALMEAYEEAGLRVELTRFLMDVDRSQSYTRYYLARRVSGNPADMGWESQSVLLVPQAKLWEFLTNLYDKPLLKALQAPLFAPSPINAGNRDGECGITLLTVGADGGAVNLVLRMTDAGIFSYRLVVSSCFEAFEHEEVVDGDLLEASHEEQPLIIDWPGAVKLLDDYVNGSWMKLYPVFIHPSLHGRMTMLLKRRYDGLDAETFGAWMDLIGAGAHRD